MNYELAKKLKDAGFPQKYEEKNDNGALPYTPTLSELIEACGYEFGGLIQYHKEHKTDYWEAYSYQGMESKTVRGDTPEEAVANLWLELNKK